MFSEALRAARSVLARMLGSAVVRLTATLALLLLLSAGASAGTDVNTGLGGNEPHAAVVNPQNPSQVAVGQFCTVAISNDFGRTFPITRSANPCSGFGGDISLAYDSQGRLFVAYLAQQGADNELTVMAGQVANTTTPGPGTFNAVAVSADDGSNDDKEWIAADSNPASPFRDNLYIVWTDLARGRATLPPAPTETCTSPTTPMPVPVGTAMRPERPSSSSGAGPVAPTSQLARCRRKAPPSGRGRAQ